MTSRARSLRLILTAPLSYRRIVFLLLGSALAMAFALLDVTLVALALQAGLTLWLLVPLGTALVVVPVLVLGLMPPTRYVEAVAAESFLGVRFANGTPGVARDWQQRRRSLGWFLLHLLVGAAVVTMVVLVAGMPPHLLLTPLAVVGALLVLVALGWVMARLAPTLLGPSPSERMRLLEAEAARQAERNRIAREIHDSVGHALSLVTVQAAAARKVISRDPAFAVEALGAIEQASRNAAGDLDHMLGLLRDDSAPSATAPQPDLGRLDVLLDSTRLAGFEVDSRVAVEVAALPLLVSREAYRIIQEGLTNAVRYGVGSTVSLRLAEADGSLLIRLTNPCGADSPGVSVAARPGTPAPSAQSAQLARPGRAGRGLRGIDERAATLRGRSIAGAEGGIWTLEVSLPTVEK